MQKELHKQREIDRLTETNVRGSIKRDRQTKSGTNKQKQKDEDKQGQ